MPFTYEWNKILDKNPDQSGVTISNLQAKLREANVTKLNQVKAAVIENTGDISVLHQGEEDHETDPLLLQDVIVA